MYIPVGLENSPYKLLRKSNLLIEVNALLHITIIKLVKINEYFFFVQAADTFLKDACNILGINKDSSLSVVTNTGCAALPALLSLKEVMVSRQVQGIWNGRDELPVS